MKLREIERKHGKTYFIDFRENGQRRRIRLDGITDRETAELAFADFQLSRARGKIGLPTNKGLVLRDCLEAYLDAKRGEGCVAKHMETLEARVAQALAFFGPKRPVKELSERSVAEWREVLAKDENTPDTVNRKTHLLKAALALAVRSGHIAENPLQGLGKISDKRPEPWRWLRENEIAALLGVLRDGKEVEIAPGNRKPYKQTLGQNPELYALCVFLLNSGARRGEALALTWRQVDFKGKRVALHTTKTAARGKRAKVRYVPLTPALAEVLKGMPKDRERVFQISEHNVNRAFNRIWELAGIGPCRLHDLRHTYAAHLVSGGVPLNTTRELLGHASLAMTLKYAHLAPEATAKAVEALSYGGAKKPKRAQETGKKTGAGKGA